MQVACRAELRPRDPSECGRQDRRSVVVFGRVSGAFGTCVFFSGLGACGFARVFRPRVCARDNTANPLNKSCAMGKIEKEVRPIEQLPEDLEMTQEKMSRSFSGSLPQSLCRKLRTWQSSSACGVDASFMENKATHKHLF